MSFMRDLEARSLTYLSDDKLRQEFAWASNITVGTLNGNIDRVRRSLDVLLNPCDRAKAIAQLSIYRQWREIRIADGWCNYCGWHDLCERHRKGGRGPGLGK